MVIRKLAKKEELDIKYNNHTLNNSKYYKNCGECHIEPDWLLVYQYKDEQLILLLVATGSHSEIFLKKVVEKVIILFSNNLFYFVSI